jgi:ribosomal protein S12 methylthiotransferase accessory factor
VETVNISFPGGKRIDAQIGEFTIHTDQSEKSGGSASAPEPFDLFLASIATCAGIFAWNFCQARDIPTAGIDLRMDCARDEKKKLFTEMRLHLTLPEDFPEKYRSGIVRAMELCAVKRHIREAPQFIIEIED